MDSQRTTLRPCARWRIVLSRPARRFAAQAYIISMEGEWGMHENGLQREIGRDRVDELHEGHTTWRELPLRGTVLGVRCEEEA
jgi:hypothetical protein